nr:isoform 2 of cbl-interacting serine/threonine-protein kinase 8 [Quercus suber]
MTAMGILTSYIAATCQISKHCSAKRQELGMKHAVINTLYIPRSAVLSRFSVSRNSASTETQLHVTTFDPRICVDRRLSLLSFINEQAHAANSSRSSADKLRRTTRLTAINKPGNTKHLRDMEPLQVAAPKGVETELLMIGSCSCTYRHGQVVIKISRVDEEADITQGNAKATTIEANVYQILGTHDRIANCLYISPTKDMIMLEFYSHGNLKDYIAIHGLTQLHKWATQMIEAVQFIHSKGVRHSDLRLDQWLLDSGTNARLSDFNSSGYDECPAFGLNSEKALGNEDPSHFMPRDPSEDNTIRSDLFALGSALYEIEHGSAPFADAVDETITQRFALREFPAVSHLILGSIISGAWEGKFDTAVEMLQMSRQLWSSSDATRQS